MIRQINQHVQKHYKIKKPQFLDIPKHQDFGKRKTYYINKLKKLQTQYGLKDADTLGLYHQRFWEEFIYNAANQYKYKLPLRVHKGLTKRWAFFDKTYTVNNMKNDITDDGFLDWVRSFDKTDHARYVKDTMKPFEILFFELGAEILQNVKGYSTASPDKAVQKMTKELSTAIKTIKRSRDVSQLNKLSNQLEKLNAIGGIKSIVPSEGIVFKYKGKTYKFTGAFAPVNAITGIIKFGN